MASGRGGTAPLLCVDLPAGLFKSKGRTEAFHASKGSTTSTGGIDHLVMHAPKHGTAATFDLGGKHVALAVPSAGNLRVTLGIGDEAGASCGAQTVQLRANKRGALRFP